MGGLGEITDGGREVEIMGEGKDEEKGKKDLVGHFSASFSPEKMVEEEGKEENGKTERERKGVRRGCGSGCWNGINGYFRRGSRRLMLSAMEV
ncbi:uncharacterized protein G2W53_026564 [Senna tora]|uniref:Uncharacterized protein n=1 Tax=Senna tora TaxID=362788 RepID=A0A834THE9_9FABA|nr:uncharacterized protein G2W53_026564 [Senna tora]